jgi:hypothetical protein
MSREIDYSTFSANILVSLTSYTVTIDRVS